MKIRYQCFLIVALLLCVAGVRAQWTMDPSQNAPISVGNHDANAPQMAPDGNGGAYIVWYDYRLNSSSPRLYCQHVEANGNRMWAVGGIKVSSQPGDQLKPVITSDSAGGVFIAWDGVADTNESREELFAQRINSSGTLLWGAAGINVTQSTMFDLLSTLYITIVADGVGGFYAAWDENVSIYMGRVNASGTVLWKKSVTPYSVTQPKIARTGDGGAAIAYNDARAGASGDFGNVFTQKVDSTGTVLWGAEGAPACDAAGMQNNPDIVSDGSGGVIVAWEDFRSRSQYKVFAQHLNADGNRTWITGSDSSGVAVCTSTDTQGDPQLGDGLDGAAVVTWADGRKDVYAQKLRSNGSLLWGANGVQVTNLSLGRSENERIVGDGAGGAFLMWCDTRNLGSLEDVFAQRISSAGVPQWTANGISVSTGSHSQVDPVIVADGKGNLIGLWLDERITNSGQYRDIYAQKVAGSGALLDVHENRSSTPRQFNLSQNYPNPFNPSTVIRFSVEKAGLTSLIVYNVLGDEVAHLFEGNAEPGKEYTATFNATNLSSGVYYYRLFGAGASNIKSMILVK